MSAGGPARPVTEADLRFKRQPMVDWLRPTFLLRAGLEVFLSGLFARFADKRELEVGLTAERSYVADHDADGALWIDYAADVGEGFDSTYTVARLLAAPSLTFETAAGVQATSRGRPDGTPTATGSSAPTARRCPTSPSPRSRTSTRSRETTTGTTG
jgi:hypothetical protein